MDYTRDSLLPRRDPIMSQNSQQRLRSVQRQNSFLSPIRSNNSNNNNRRLSSTRSSLARSPDRMESDRDRKRKRLSLLPSNGLSNLGAPRLINPSNQRRQSIINNNINNVTSTITSNTPFSQRNIGTGKSIQQMVQNSITRSGIPMNTQRRSIVDSRRNSTLPPSSASANSRLDLQASTTSKTRKYMKPQDPRPVRSHRFQTQVKNELFEFLSTNKFDIEMKQPLEQKTLSNPTQKEFVSIFQWLYKRLDPGYQFSKMIDNDVYSLLKFLEYPYLDTVNKSQISAVGGTNWPTFLAMLHWLLKLVKETIKFDNLDIYSFQEVQPNKGFDTDSNDIVLFDEQPVMNKLFLTYVLDSYRTFLATGEDDYSEFYSEMENDYLAYIDDVQVKLDQNTDRNENLKEKLDVTKENYDLFFDELERANALKTDVSKFQNYIDIQKQRQSKWPNIIEKAKSDINNITESIKNINKEKQDIIDDLAKRNLTLKDIEDLHKERARLTLSLNSIDAEQKQSKELIESKNDILKSQVSDLRNKIDTYNNSIYLILNNLSLDSPFDASTLIINSINDEYHTTKLGESSHDIIPNLSTLRNSLIELKNTIQSHTSKLQEDILQAQEVLDDLKLTIVSQTDKLEELEDSLSKSRKEYSDLNEKYTTDSSNKQFDLEEKAKEIRLFKLQSTENRKSIESKWKNAEKEYKKTISIISESRTQLVCDIAQGLDYVVSFKGDIMTDLENTVQEVNQELKQQVDSEFTHE